MACEDYDYGVEGESPTATLQPERRQAAARERPHTQDGRPDRGRGAFGRRRLVPREIPGGARSHLPGSLKRNIRWRKTLEI